MIGTPEFIIILIAALFLFGPNKLPELARSMGKATGEFKKAQMQTEREIRKSQMNTEYNLKTTEKLVEDINLKIESEKTLPIEKAGV